MTAKKNWGKLISLFFVLSTGGYCFLNVSAGCSYIGNAMHAVRSFGCQQILKP